MKAETTVKKNIYAGLFMVTLATLMYEILLTRIFSVTMWYHYAFMAISIAMFGMTVGAVLVYLAPEYFTRERAKYHLALSSWLFTVTILFSFLTHLSIPFVPLASTTSPIVSVYSIVLTYLVISVPFVFSGICVCLALTKFPREISKLYAADLAGSAIGCILLIKVLEITDGPTAVVVVTFFASIGTVFLAAGDVSKKLMRTALASSILLLLFAAGHSVLVRKQSSLLRPVWVKGKKEKTPLYEKWNSFSRIRVTGNMKKKSSPFGWGLSPVYPPERKIKQLRMDIDSRADTQLTAFNGDLSVLEHLKYDITNLAHYIRQNSKVLAVGTGGGRDILSALVFKQKSVLGVEINKNIIDAVNQRFGDFTGHLDRYPQVSFVNDEARSYIARQKDKFDIIQVSFIDTWAATAAGAFVLTENSLYTVESWRIFLEHLTPGGVLTFTRWFFNDRPGEVYRLTSLAAASLKQMDIKNPRDHIIIVKGRFIVKKKKNVRQGLGVGTMLVSKEPFSDEDVDIIKDIAEKLAFDIVLAPDSSSDPTFKTLASGKDTSEFIDNYPINISAPTDDSPFFFNMLRLRDMFNQELWDQTAMVINMKAVFILGVLLATVVVLTFLCIIVPLAITTDKADLVGEWPLFIFFASIGLGFMMIEISQMQRLIIFLGHPTYGLAVVLFALLLSSGLGSYLTQTIGNSDLTTPAVIRLSYLLCALIGLGILTPYATYTFRGSTTMMRILVAVGILLPLGLFMGMAFPLGMKIASKRSTAITPWLWGINGATSVCGSVLATAISLSINISTSYWMGFSCYLVAWAAFVWASRREQ